MASNIEMKIIKFSFENQQIKYKFPSNDSIASIDAGIRREFNIENDINYSLVDVEDDSTVSLSCLAYLKNETTILIKLKNLNSRTNIWGKAPNITPLSQMASNLNSNRKLLSFSDKNEKLFTSDLSSTSGSNDSDYKTSIHYNSTVPISGETKLSNAQMKKNKRELKILCTRKIYYFFETHCGIQSIHCRDVAKQIMEKLNIEFAQLYNLLKYIRNKMNIHSLNLNKQNAIDIIIDVYQNKYINDNNKDDNDLNHNLNRQ